MRALIEFVPVMVVLYVTFLLGQVNQRRKNKDRRDPLPVINAARTLLVERQVNDYKVSDHSAGMLAIALDQWDRGPE